MVIFCTFFEIFQGFKEIWETLCTNFVNYLMEILGMKLFQRDFRKMAVKLPVKS